MIAGFYLLLAAIVTALATLGVARYAWKNNKRISSGNIDTTEAATLWNVVTGELAATRSRIEKLEIALQTCQDACEALHKTLDRRHQSDRS